MPIAVTVEHVAKKYRLGTIDGYTLQADVARWWAGVRGLPDPSSKVQQDHHPRRVGDEFWALNDVSFEVKEGEVVGVVGRNGAGKSTLFKILSQVTAPTSGRVTLRGRVASLLEVGTGFHPDLTGRENVFLNGAILGMTKAEISRNFDAIVAFSECGEFIDTPVKRYSSGMYVRLAFAVAAHLEAEILIVDEVLAVGDIAFQKKCFGKMRDVSSSGRSVLFVSHSMPAVSALCTRAILMRDGEVVADGATEDVVACYQSESLSQHDEAISVADMPRTGSGRGRFVSIAIETHDAIGDPLPAPVTGCNLSLTVALECRKDFAHANVAVIIYDSSAYRVIDANTALKGDVLSMQQGEAVSVRFCLTDLLLKPGTYSISLWLGRPAIEELDHVAAVATFEMHGSPSRHTQTFPGIYQCRFTHEILTGAAADAPLVARSSSL